MSGYGVGHEGEQLAHAGVEQERLVAADEELVEREAGRWGDLVDVSREPEDVGGDLVDGGGSRLVRGGSAEGSHVGTTRKAPLRT